MSILQEYEDIRRELGEEEWNNIDTFLSENEQYQLSDVLYTERVWKIYEDWKRGKSNMKINRKRSIKSNRKVCRRPVKASTIMSASDISGMKILVRSKAYVDITEDSYEHGASLGAVNQWDFDVRGEYDSMQDLIDDIHSVSYQVFSNNIDDYSFGDGALRTSAMVNDENDVPTDEEYEEFKRGEITLYIADMWLPLEVGSVHDMTDDEAESFGIKEIW